MRSFARMPAVLFACATLLTSACGKDAQGIDTSSNEGGGPGFGAMTYRKVALPQPDGLTVGGIFDLAAAGEAAWVSAYTYDAATHDNGPMVLWEKRPGAGFVLGVLPPTTLAYFPDVCAVSAEEVYVLAADGPEQKGRLFARRPGPEPVFEEQPAAHAPDGRHFNAMRLACFPGGNLWAYGAMQKGGDIHDQVHALFHRPAEGAAWEAVPLPADLPSKFWSTGASLALLRADGSGYVGFSMGEAARIYERTADGAWAKVHELGDEVFQISGASGDPGERAVAVAQPKGEEGIVLVLEGATWSTAVVPDASELRATARTPDGGLLVGGVRYIRTGDMITGAEAILLDGALAPVEAPFRGRIHAMAFASTAGYIAVDFTESPEDTGLYEGTWAAP